MKSDGKSNTDETTVNNVVNAKYFDITRYQEKQTINDKRIYREMDFFFSLLILIDVETNKHIIINNKKRTRRRRRQQHGRH